MTWYDYYRIGIDVITVGITPVAILIYKLLNRIKSNDMEHIAGSLQDIKDGQTEIRTLVVRHLEDHATGKFDHHA